MASPKLTFYSPAAAEIVLAVRRADGRGEINGTVARAAIAAIRQTIESGDELAHLSVLLEGRRFAKARAALEEMIAQRQSASGRRADRRLSKVVVGRKSSDAVRKSRKR